MGRMSERDWWELGAQLRKEAKAARRKAPKRRPSEAIQDLQEEVRDIHRWGQERGWDRFMRQRLAQIAHDIREIEQEEAGPMSLDAVRLSYAEMRVMNWSHGLAYHIPALAQAVADAARREGRPIPPEVLDDFPDLT